MATLRLHNPLRQRPTLFYVAILGYLALVASHLLDFHAFVLLALGLLLVDYRRVKTVETGILAALVGSIYITWYLLDPAILHNYQLPQGLLAFVMYLIALSFPFSSTMPPEKRRKRLYYLLFSPYIVYTLLLGLTLLFHYYQYSRELIPICAVNQHFVIPKPHEPLIVRMGIHVWYDNVYSLSHINGGREISTIIAYYLTPAALLVAVGLFLLKGRIAIRAKTVWLHLLLALVVGSLAFYIASVMGRRTVVLVALLAFGYLSVRSLWRVFRTATPKQKRRGAVIVALLIVAALGIGYETVSGTDAWRRIVSVSLLHDKRFSFWIRGFEVMLHYPWGGGYGVYIAKSVYLSHNTLIDIGKYFGVIPFLLALVFFTLHLYRFWLLWRMKHIDAFTKDVFTVLAIAFGTILMVEPVFVSDKIFFALVMFYLGLLRNVASKKSE